MRWSAARAFPPAQDRNGNRTPVNRGPSARGLPPQPARPYAGHNGKAGCKPLLFSPVRQAPGGPALLLWKRRRAEAEHRKTYGSHCQCIGGRGDNSLSARCLRRSRSHQSAGGDIAPPQVQAFLHRRQRMKGGDALAGGYFLQQAVLQR